MYSDSDIEKAIYGSISQNGVQNDISKIDSFILS
jgi:hypothetical protein